MSCHHVSFLSFQASCDDNAVEKNGGLRISRLSQLIFRPFKADCTQGQAQKFIGLQDQFFRVWSGLKEIPDHTDVL
jgi:hypothetical protein